MMTMMYCARRRLQSLLRDGTAAVPLHAARRNGRGVTTRSQQLTVDRVSVDRTHNTLLVRRRKPSRLRTLATRQIYQLTDRQTANAGR